MMPAISHRAGALAVALVAAALGCGGSAEQPFTLIPLVPDPKATHDERFLVWEGVVTIGDVPRPVLSASKVIAVAPEIAQGNERQMRVSIPEELKGVAWIVLESTTMRDGVTSMVRSWPVIGRQAGGTYPVSIVPERLGPGGQPGVRLWPVPDLALRDVETAAIAVQPHTVLQVGAGIEPVSWDSTAVPIDMTVSSVDDGKAKALRTIRIDPRKPENRQWVDISIPLDDVAGRTVRFRFSARAMIGPSTVPSLPVWAEPMMVDASLAGPH
jgi:hypothetical protein